ncbi:MAG: hypothetical protein CL608_15235 [Anaerolineaceae bacterium]|nr:hypothetical protein [Anaerolineaceae bacterium]
MLRISEKRLVLFSGLAVMLLAGWLYWRTLRLPLIYDTLLHIRIVGGLNFASVWLPTEAFGFYRPMTFFPMLVINSLFDGYPAWLLHGNNILQHAANAGLLVWLSWRLWPNWRRAAAAGAIFAVIPFSYQAVSIYGHNVHPAMTGLVLLGLHGYLTAVSRPTSRKWWIITWFLFVVMVLTHETVVLFGGFAALVHLNYRPEALGKWLGSLRQKAWRALLRLPWLHFLLAGVLYLIIYQFLPISRAPQVEVTGTSLWLNFLYLLQAAVFPLAWFAHLLPNVSGVWVTLVSGGLVVAATGWLAWQRPNWRKPLLLAWGWWAGASVLIGLTLPTGYLLRGPRLLYLGGVGAALLWALLLDGIWPQVNSTLTPPALSLKGEGANSLPLSGGGLGRGLVWTAVLGFILITSGQFVQTKLDEYEQLTQPVPVMQQAHILNDAEILLINLPQWLDVPPNTYAVGVEFVTMLGDYLFVEELTSANLTGEHEAWAVSLPELQSSQAYAYGIQDQHEWPTAFNDRPRHIFITYFLADGPETHHTGYVLPRAALPPIAPPNSIAQFGVYNLTEAAAEACNGIVTVSSRWLADDTNIPDTTSIFAQVLDADGSLLTQADGPPLGIRPGLLAASPDDLLVDMRGMELVEGETAVPHTVLVGVYDFASGERSPATDATGQPLPDDAWRLPVANCR